MQQKKFFSLITCVLVLLYSHCALAQQDTSNTIGRVSIASPNAASLGKYGDIPVSYFTGIPNINVPVYTVKSGSLELPISLSYHSGGLKVQENASWVGAGWSLNAGGVITRSVVGAPDDRGNNNLGTNNVVKGYYSDYGFQSYIVPSDGVEDMNFVQGRKDGEPDLFFFNFAGHSGKFYFNDDRTPVLLPEEDYKIETNFQLGAGFTGFKITTSDGTKYYFGQTNNNGSVDPIESTIPFNLQNGVSNPANSAWYLNKIISADGIDSILFNYQQERYATYTLAFSPVLSSNYYPNDPSKNGTNLVKNFIYGVRLTSITYPTGTITLSPTSWGRSDLSSGATIQMYDSANNSAFALDNISIASSTGFCKKFKFNYGYFYDASPLNSNYFSGFTPFNIKSDQYRLRLDSLQEISCDNSIQKPSYKFSYFSETVPRKLSFGIDHWGYSNGVTTNSTISTLVPTYIVTDNTGNSTIYNGANRDASWPAMRCGALQQIAYPTGGTTVLDYESKDAGNYTNTITTNSYVPISSLSVHMYGQSAISNSSGFSSNGNAITVNVSNYANYPATLIIWNSSNSIVYSDYNIPNGTGYSAYNSTYTLYLGAGNYTYTVSLPGYGNLTGGTSISFWQWQNTTSTTTQTLLVSGLRIKTITNNDGITVNNTVTSYDYKAGGSTSTGFLYSRPTYVQILRNDILGLVWPYNSPAGCASIDGVGAHSYYVSPGTIQPMQNAQGENEGFGEVDVTQSGNGKTIYRYYGNSYWSTSNSDVCIRSIKQSSICDNTIPNYPSAPVPFDFMRGELKYEGTYNQGGQILKESYHFPVYSNDPLITPGHIATNLPGMYSYTEYNLQSAKKISDSTVSNNYDPSTGNYQTTSEAAYYSSPYHHMPTIKNSFTSKGEIVSNVIKYAFDFKCSTCTGVSDGVSDYLNAYNADNTWLQNNIYYCSPQVNNISNCRSSVFTQYRLKLQQDRINFINYRTQNYWNTLNNNFQSALGTADGILKPVLRLQDEFMNAPVETAIWKNWSLLKAHYTNYGYVSNPVNYVYPVSDQAINLSSPSTSFSQASVSGNTIALDNRYQIENTVNYNAGRVVDVTSKAGVTTAYLWGYNNQYPVAKITGALYSSASGLVNSSTINNISTSDVNMRSALSGLRTGLTGALVSTYTYSPMLGISSETDQRGYTISHEYDGLGRLSRSRDKDGNILKQYNYAYGISAALGTGASTFNISVSNNTSYSGYIMYLTAVSGGSSTSLYIPFTGSGSVGPVVPGVYNVLITPPPARGSLFVIFTMGTSNSLYSSGTTASFNNITLGPSNYNTINIY